jgi:hypothetical protein
MLTCFIFKYNINFRLRLHIIYFNATQTWHHYKSI